jgi:uncharacterized membrane protein YhhN
VKKSLLLVAFILVASVHLLGVVMGWSGVEMITKPLIMTSLIVYYLANTPFRSPVFLLALFLSGVGDTLLLFQSSAEIYFVLGLVAFLLAHVFYFFTYRRHRFAEQVIPESGPQKMRLSFPILLAGTGLVTILWPVLGPLQIPVMAYAFVLTMMVLGSIFRLGRTTPASFWLVFSGAFLFMASDSLLAINKFLQPLHHAGGWIMLTYCLAQFLIVEGVVRHPSQYS